MTIEYNHRKLWGQRRETIHDLRNLFAVVAAAKHGLERTPERAPPRSELLAALGDVALRGGRLTSNLLAESPHCDRTVAIDVGVRLAQLAPMINALAGTRIELDLAVGFARARIDPAEFDASVLELVKNACKAGANHIALRSRLAGARLWILICDDGRGMPPALLACARHGQDRGRRHGAGLARVHRFIRSAHGSLRIRSRPAIGTAIALILPTVLSPATCRPLVMDPTFPYQHKEISNVKDRQPTAA